MTAPADETGTGCNHAGGVCNDRAHQGLGGEADRDWFAAQRRRMAENRAPATVPADTDDSRERAELTRRAEQLWSDLIDQDNEGALGILRQYVAAMDDVGERWAAALASPAARPAERPFHRRLQIAAWLKGNTSHADGDRWALRDVLAATDELLALPALAPLLALRERVEALLPRLDREARISSFPLRFGYVDAAKMLRRALDGTGR